MWKDIIKLFIYYSNHDIIIEYIILNKIIGLLLIYNSNLIINNKKILIYQGKK